MKIFWIDLSNALTFEAMVLHYNAEYFKNLQNDNSEEAERQLLVLIRKMEEREDMINESPGMYVSSINNLISYYVFRKEYDQAMNLVTRARKIYDNWKISQTNRTLLKQILRTYNVELEIYRDTGSLYVGSNQLEQLEQFVNSNSAKMPVEYWLSFSFQLANIHFVNKEHHKALYWINMIINNKHKEYRPDIHLQARWLNLMIHTDQRNLFVLRYFVDSTRRFIRKGRRLKSHEDVLLRFFSAIGRAPLLDYPERFLQLREELFPKGSETIIPQEELDYVNISSWIDGKIRKG